MAIDVNTLVNAAYTKDLNAALAADAVLDAAAIAKLKADSAAALKAALATDAAADAVVLKAKDDEIAKLKADLAACLGGPVDPPPPPPPPPPPDGQPTAANTGAKGDFATVYTGTKTITAAGVTIENKTITGALRVTGANFVMKNCKHTFAGEWGIDAEDAVNPTIQDCTLIGPGSTGGSNSAFLGSGTLLRNDISKCENGIVLQGGKSVVKGNYIHDLLDPGADPHYDGISVQGGQNDVLIEGNAIHGRDTADVFIKNDFGSITNVRVNANWLLGNPGWCAYSDGRGPNGTITGVQFTNNICRISSNGQYFSIDLNTVVKTGNVDTSGKPVG